MSLRTLTGIETLLILLLSFACASADAANTDYRSPEHVDGAETIVAARARELFDQGVKFIDVRNSRLYARRHIPGAHHLDLKHVYNEQTLAAVAGKDEPIVVYCSGVKCSRSYRASEKAVSWGYSKVYYFRGGIVDWREAGYPIETAER